MTILKTFSIFAKFWEKGKVKTRLARSIGESEAADIYFEFLKVSLGLGRNWDGRRVLGYSPEEKKSEFQNLAPEWELIPQVTLHAGKKADLGVRMKRFFDSVFLPIQSDPIPQDHRVILIGSDSPLITFDRIEAAFEKLEDNDVVIGPSLDGGYYLIGARDQTPDLFDDIQWSSEQVLAQTIQQLKAKGYRYCLLEPHEDVDDIDDLRRMVSELKHRSFRSADQNSLLNIAEKALSKVDSSISDLPTSGSTDDDSESSGRHPS